MVRRGWKLTAEAVQARARGVRRRVDAGMTTAEYAVGTLAVALIAVARSDMVRGALARVIQTALGAGG
jgi:hypothetical protein